LILKEWIRIEESALSMPVSGLQVNLSLVSVFREFKIVRNIWKLLQLFFWRFELADWWELLRHFEIFKSYF